MQLPGLRKALLRRIVLLTGLIILSAVLVVGILIQQQRLPDQLLDKSINFHSRVMHDVNNIITHLNFVLHDIEQSREAIMPQHQVEDADYAFKKFLSRTVPLYQHYDFKAGTKTLTGLQQDSRQLELIIRRASAMTPADLSPLQNQIRATIDRLQQLYRLHEADESNLRMQLAHYEKQRYLTTVPLFILILLLSGLSGFHLLRKIFLSLEVQNKLEMELRESAGSHQQILNSMFAFVGLFSTGGRLLEMNEAPLKATGLRREDVMGKEVWELYPLAYSQESKDTIKALITRAAAGEVVRQDVKIMVLGEQYIFMDSNFSPVYDYEGKIEYVIASGVDITARKNAEEELRSNAQRQEFLLSASPAVIYTRKAAGNLAATYISPNFHEQFGYTAEEFMRDPAFWDSNIHPEDISRVYQGFTALFEHDAYSHQYRLRMPDGSYHWVQDDLRLIRNSDGTPREIIGSWRDINTTKYAEELQRLNEERLKEAQHIANFGNWELNLLTDTLIWSDEVYRIFELDKDRFHASYEAFLNLVHPEDRERVKTAYENSLKTRSPYEITHRLLMPDGRIKWATERCQSFFDVNGAPLRSIGTVQDITLQYNTRLELQTGRAITDELFANLQGMVYRCKNDPDWTLEFVSEGITPLTGYTPREFVEDHSVNFGELIHPEDAQRVWDTVQEGLKHHALYDIMYRIRTRSGAIKWVAERGHGVFTDDGQLLYLQGLVIDDTQRKRTEQALELAHTAINKSKSAFFWINLEGKVMDVNDYACQNLGYTRKELTGMDIWDFDPDFPPDALPPNIERMKQQGAIVFESRHRRKDGSIFPIEVTANYITLGNESHIFTFVQDISERKKAEEIIHESEQRLRGLLEFSPIAVRIARAGREVVFCNQSYATLVKIERNKVIGIDPRSYYAHPDEYDRILGELTRGATIRNQLVELKISGERTTWALASYELIQYEGENAIIGWFYDITALKNAEQALRASEEALRRLNESLEERVVERARELQSERNFINSVLETAGALVFVFDNKGRIVRFNRACEALTGYRFEEVKDRPFWEILAPAEQSAAMQSMLDNLEQFTRTQNRESEWLTRSGERRIIEWSSTIMTGEDDQKIAYIIGTGIDITDRKKAEAALIQTKEEAERASKAKSQFLSRMSHELRTPMNAILGFSQILELELQESGQKEHVHEILRASHHLLELINELLDLSRIEAGYLHVTLEPLSPAAIVSEAVNLVWPLVEKKKLALHNETAAAHNHPVLADATRLKQVLVNLLSNAAKYNKPGGSIRVDCTLLDEDHLRLSITDTGPGIAPDKQPMLFQPFERLGAETTQVEGAGIGLALTKRLVELMGGDIGVNSIVGTGSTFWVDLPRAMLKSTILRPSSRGPVSAEEIRTKVLYVEDNAANLRLVERVLSRNTSLFLIAAVNGETGLELAKAHHPDVILLDIHLPGIDGYEVLKRLRADPLTAAIPVIAISADAMPLDIERGLKAGFRHYLTKPINIDELIDAINNSLPRDRTMVPPDTLH